MDVPIWLVRTVGGEIEIKTLLHNLYWSVGLWVCGSVGLWVCGSVGLWVCGSVGGTQGLLFTGSIWQELSGGLDRRPVHRSRLHQQKLAGCHGRRRAEAQALAGQPSHLRETVCFSLVSGFLPGQSSIVILASSRYASSPLLTKR